MIPSHSQISHKVSVCLSNIILPHTKLKQYVCLLIACGFLAHTSVSAQSDNELLSIVENLDQTNADEISDITIEASQNTSRFKAEHTVSFDSVWQQRVLGILVHQFVNDVLPDLYADNVTVKKYQVDTFLVEVDVAPLKYVNATVYDYSGKEVTSIQVPKRDE